MLGPFVPPSPSPTVPRKGYGMPEADLSWLTLLVFLPAAAAALLLVVPARWVEAQRWVALFGAAGTLSVPLCVAVGYDDAIGRQLGTSGRPGHAATARLDSRADLAAANAAKAVPEYRSDDW